VLKHLSVTDRARLTTLLGIYFMGYYLASCTRCDAIGWLRVPQFSATRTARIQTSSSRAEPWTPCLPLPAINMSDPLSIAASVAGLIALTGQVYQLLVRYIDNDMSYSKEFKELASEIRGLCGVLRLLQDVIERREQQLPEPEQSSTDGCFL